MPLDARTLTLLVTLATPLMTGCLVGEDEPPAAAFPLEVYEYRYTGDNVVVPGHPYGFLARVHNPTDEQVQVVVDGRGAVDAWGPVFLESGWNQDMPEFAWPLLPGRSAVYFFQITDTAQVDDAVGFAMTASFADTPGVTQVFERILSTASGATPVQPGDHVRTATVGLWTNGTSFYTNIAELNADDAFPAGYDRATFAGDHLPVYVYDQENAEQPPRSRDTCHFTTITGYNALLKTQAEWSTNVRFLQPEEAYTLPGREDHELYGDPLIFMNTVMAHDGATDQMDSLPDPLGACFDAARYSPLDVPPVLR